MVAAQYYLSIATLAAIVAATPIGKRDVNTISADITDVKTKLTALNAALDTYQGGIISALPVQNAASPLETSIGKAATDIAAEPPTTSEADAKVILAAVRDLQPVIKSSTDLVITKAPLFGSLKSTVKGDMERLKVSSDKISSGLLSRVPESLKTEATKEKEIADGYFDAAIKSVSA